MNHTIYTLEGSELQTTVLANALKRAKECAQKVKHNVTVFINGQKYCSVAKNGKLLIG